MALGYPFVNAITCICSLTIGLSMFPGLIEPFKIIVQLAFVAACAYVIRGKDTGTHAIEIKGYQLMRYVYISFISLALTTVVLAQIPQHKPTLEYEIWVLFDRLGA